MPIYYYTTDPLRCFLTAFCHPVEFMEEQKNKYSRVIAAAVVSERMGGGQADRQEEEVRQNTFLMSFSSLLQAFHLLLALIRQRAACKPFYVSELSEIALTLWGLGTPTTTLINQGFIKIKKKRGVLGLPFFFPFIPCSLCPSWTFVPCTHDPSRKSTIMDFTYV